MDTKTKIPNQFSSVDEMHRLGFYLSSEIPKPNIHQNWARISQEAGYSIPELARLTGLRRQSIYAALANNTQLSLESAFRISLILGISMEEAFQVDKDTLFRPCVLGGSYIYIDPKTLTTLPESKRRKLKGSESYKTLEILYESLFTRNPE